MAAERSDDYTPSNETDRIVFGSGAVLVQMGLMDVGLGPLEAEESVVWEITKSDARMAKVLKEASFGGIFGMGWKDEDYNRSTVLEHMDVNAFTFCLGSRKQDGMLHIGTTLPDREQVFAPVVSKNHWGVTLADITVDRTDVKGISTLCNGSPCGALIDSGTSQIIVPPEHVGILKDMIGPIDSHCSNYDELPDLIFKVGGNEVRLTKRAYTKRVVLGGVPKVYPNPDGGELIYQHTEETEWCWLSIGSAMFISKEHGPIWILGMPFFREHLVSFDRDKKEIGFGEPCGPPPEKEPEKSDVEQDICEDGRLVDENGDVITDCDAFFGEDHALLHGPPRAPVEVMSPGLNGSAF
jgi:hypothetical protein